VNTTKLISVIIPNYNRVRDILDALQSIRNQDLRDFEVIVVDDASTDGSVPSIRKHFPEVKVIALTEKQGPAIVRNIGIKQAHGSIIVGIDSDVVLSDKSTLRRVVSVFSSRANIACLAFRILNHFDDKDDAKTWWHPLAITSHAAHEFYTDYFSGSGYAFRKEVFERAGYYPEDLFMDGEEVDLALRILDSGFEILYYPSIVVFHKLSKKSRQEIIPYYYKRRNQLWIVVKYYPFIKGLFYLIPRLAKTFLLASLHGDFATYIRALRDGISGIPNALKFRQPLKRETWCKIKQIRKGQYMPKLYSKGAKR